MKVALVHKRFAPLGGTEGYVWELARRLAERGDEVHAVCAEAAPGFDSRIHVRRVRCLPLGPTARMASYAIGADRLVRREAFDLVHGFGKTLRHDLYRLGGGCHATYLERAHRAGAPPWLRRLAAATPHQRATLAIERRTFAPGNWRALVTNSRMVRDDLVARYRVPPEGVRVLYSGVDLDRFRPRPDARAAVRREGGIGRDEFLLAFVGSGYARKGLDPLLRALALVRAGGVAARLLVVGRDRRPRAYARLAAALGLSPDAVLFRGARAEVEREYAAADLFVLPTLYDPFANATLEAMACGLPAITTDANGAAEALLDGEGLVVSSPPSPQSLAEAIRAFADPARRSEASARARARAERHPREGHWRELLALYGEVARGGDPHP